MKTNHKTSLLVFDKGVTAKFMWRCHGSMTGRQLTEHSYVWCDSTAQQSTKYWNRCTVATDKLSHQFTTGLVEECPGNPTRSLAEVSHHYWTSVFHWRHAAAFSTCRSLSVMLCGDLANTVLQLSTRDETNVCTKLQSSRTMCQVNVRFFASDKGSRITMYR